MAARACGARAFLAAVFPRRRGEKESIGRRGCDNGGVLSRSRGGVRASSPGEEGFHVPPRGWLDALSAVKRRELSPWSRGRIVNESRHVRAAPCDYYRPLLARVARPSGNQFANSSGVDDGEKRAD